MREEDPVGQLISVRLEALKLIKDWSAGLIVVQSGAIAVVGAFLQTVPSGWRLGLVIILLLSLITSIYIGAVAVIGTIPYIAQTLPEKPECDIYACAGGLEKAYVGKGLTNRNLGQLCLLQARLFTLSLVLFAIFAVSREHPKPEPNHVVVDQPVKVQTSDSAAK
ncbi:MAG: hypothetical protein M3362_01980 [Acidobacteriota bacterium]|nr:hypothetical protein [Acidobacteriota bacterium]